VRAPRGAGILAPHRDWRTDQTMKTSRKERNFPMFLKTLTAVTVAVLAFATVCCAQGSVFSLDGGSQTSTVNLAKGVTSFNFTNSAFLNTLAPPTAPNGNICVNLYVYDPTPSEVLCCSCLVKSFQTINLAISNELLYHLPAHPAGVSAFVLATPAGVATTCPSPPTVTQGQVIPFGLEASEKVFYSLFVPDNETRFTPFILGPQTTAQLTAACATAPITTCTTCIPGAQ